MNTKLNTMNLNLTRKLTSYSRERDDTKKLLLLSGIKKESDIFKKETDLCITKELTILQKKLGL